MEARFSSRSRGLCAATPENGLVWRAPFASLGASGRQFASLVALGVLVVLLGAKIQAQTTYTWNGGGGNDNFSTAANWSGSTLSTAATARNVLVFGGSTRTAPVVDGAYNFDSITVNSGASAFTITNGAGALTWYTTGSITNNSSNLLTISESIAFNASTVDGTINAASGGITIGGVISGASGGLIKTGTNTLILSGNNAYSGLTTVSAGTLAVTANNALGSSGVNNDTSISSGATIDFRNVNYSTIEALSLAGGTLATSTGTSTFAGAVTMTASSTVNVAGAQLTLSGVVAGNNADSLTKTGPGVLVLSGANTYKGSTTISEGSISASALTVTGSGSNANSSLGSASSAVTLGSATTSGTLNYVGVGGLTDTLSRPLTVLGNGGTLANNGGALTVSGAVTSSGIFTVNAASDVTISGVIGNGGSAGSLAKSGAGTLTLTATNTYTGSTTINQGTLSISADANLGGTSSQLTLSGGTLQNTAASALTLSSNRGISVGANGGTINTANALNFAGVFSGTGAFTKAGAGTLTLSGASNTYSGAVTLSAGSLSISGGNFSATDLDVTSGASLSIASGSTVTVSQISGTSLINGSSPLSGAGTLRYSGGASGGGGTLQLANAFTASGTILELSGGTLLLSNLGTYSFSTINITGSTTIDFGTAGVTSLSSTNLFISSGATVTVLNWVRGSDTWISTTAPVIVGGGGGNTTVSSGGTISNIVFSGYGETTTWSGGTGFSTQLAAVPEPSTYGAMLMAGCAGLFGLRRWRAKRRAAPGSVEVGS